MSYQDLSEDEQYQQFEDLFDAVFATSGFMIEYCTSSADDAGICINIWNCESLQRINVEILGESYPVSEQQISEMKTALKQNLFSLVSIATRQQQDKLGYVGSEGGLFIKVDGILLSIDENLLTANDLAVVQNIIAQIINIIKSDNQD